jgi:metal-dependent amidase/aminoacylase/carboxypeptidase family protein
MKKTIVSLLCLAALGVASPAMAQVTGTVHVEFMGPGGHSNGAYGATSALHAAGKALMHLRASTAIPHSAYKVIGLDGGNSVNSIASDGRYDVRLTAPNQSTYDAYVQLVRNTAAQGASDENKFRCVAVGATSGSGASVSRRDIRVTVDGAAITPPEQVAAGCTQGPVQAN